MNHFQAHFAKLMFEESWITYLHHKHFFKNRHTKFISVPNQKLVLNNHQREFHIQASNFFYLISYHQPWSFPANGKDLNMARSNGDAIKVVFLLQAPNLNRGRGSFILFDYYELWPWDHGTSGREQEKVQMF